MTSTQETTASSRPLLRRLASRMGILPSYVDQTGESLRWTSDATAERLLAAMGMDASTEERAADALRALRRARLRELMAPVRVVRKLSRRLREVTIRVPTTRADEVHWTLTLRTEEGMESSWSGTTHGGPRRKAVLTMPEKLPLGYHDLHLELSADGRTRRARQRLIVVPSESTPPEVRLRGRRGFGITANLYTLRSGKNWGAGDLGDLAAAARWVAREGGAFVGMNPLHALRNAGYDVSPYSPISRLFRNPIYLRVDSVPEMEHDAHARGIVASPDFQQELETLRAATMLDYERIMSLRAPVLESLHRTFVSRETHAHSRRAHEYADYRRREDPQLTNFATFMAISELHGPDARQWPEPLRDSSSAEVSALRRGLRERVDFHRWLQFELDRQLGDAAVEAAREGLTLGLYQDLAVGSAASGSDVWSHPKLFLQDATVGAPPDMYSDEGQNWGLPAINPHELRATGYEYWTRLLRSGFRHTGALRIDHALGLFRMFWVPLGESAREGAYVKSFTEDLFGILALESVRHAAIVVGEDLGTVPPEVPKVLARWGVLGSKVAVFERELHTGRFREARDYPRLALATVNTHDLPPLVGWLHDRDIELRGQLGDLSDRAQFEAMKGMRAGDRHALILSLVEAGLLPESALHHLSADATIAAIHAFIRRTPSALVGLSLDDLAKESEPVNIPGVWQDRYPSWSRRMRATLEDLLTDPRTVEALGHEHRVENAARGDE